jgi:hypothetical protein
VSGWLLGHRAMRTEFGRLGELVRDADLQDARRAAAVEQRLSLMHSLLGHHHEVEDSSIWPFLRAADPAVTELCDDLEADHHVLHGLLDQMVDTTRPLRGRAPVLRDLHAELCRHLDREEDEGKAVIFDLVPPSQWEEWELQVRRSTRSTASSLVPWLAAHLTEQERTELFGKAPKLLELVYRWIWRPRYERSTRLVYGHLPGPLGSLSQPVG